jgi:hypothetical protein
VEICTRLVITVAAIAASAGCARLTGLSDLTIDDCMNGACDGAPSTADGAGGTLPDGAPAAGDGNAPAIDGAAPRVDSGRDATVEVDAADGGPGAGSDATPPEDATVDTGSDTGRDAPVVSCDESERSGRQCGLV